jgi:hypothetical protein
VLDPGFIAVYNLFYTSQPVLALAYFDQDVKPAFSLKFPRLYTPGMLSSFFNFKLFFVSALHGFFSSMILFMLPLGAYHDKTDETGKVLSDHYLFGSVVATILVVVVTAQVALDTQYWTVWNHITIWGSLFFYFALTFLYNWGLGGTYMGSLSTVMADHTFWFVVLLTTVVLILPVVAWRFYKVDVIPTLTDRARLLQRNSRPKEKGDSGLPRPFSGRRSRRSVRSGYAFSHSEGFGRLITSGRIMKDATRGRLSTSSISRSNNNGVPQFVSSKNQLTVTPAMEGVGGGLGGTPSPRSLTVIHRHSSHAAVGSDVPGIVDS